MRLICLLLRAVAVTSCVSAAASAQVATDGSLGSAVSLVGPNFVIGTNLGQLRGGNLFHSFSTFNIGTGQSATFNVVPGVENVVARITGGGTSSIDGTIAANANVFLLNPQGIVFGAHAALNVTGSFHASTADYLRLADGARFYANVGSDSTLTLAAPAAFGFLDASVAPIAAQQASLAVPEKKTFSLIAGPITLDEVQLSASKGRVNLVSVGSAGEVSIADSTPLLGGFTAMSNVLMNHSLINAGNEEAADVFIRGGRFVMQSNSSILGVSSVADTARTLDIDVDMLQLRQSGIVSAATVNGAGANMTIHARTFDVGEGSTVLSTAAGVNGGGDIAIRSDDFRLSGSLSLVGSAAATGSGRAGNVTIDSTNVSVADGSISAVSGSTGGSGNILITANTVTLASGGGITAATQGPGNGGRVSINAKSLAIDGTVGAPTTGISAVSSSFATTSGNSGSIAINVDSLSMKGGFISSSTTGAGRGGDVSIKATTVAMSQGAAVTTDAGDPGNQGTTATFGAGGTIDVDAGAVQLLSGSRVSANTFGGGAGGSVTVAANSLTIDGTGANSTGITANSGSAGNISATGAGGNIFLNVSQVDLRNTGEISASTFGVGIAGRISISSDSLSVTGSASIASSSFGVVPNAGNANDIVIRSDQLVVKDGGQISNSTFGSGAAGQLLVDARSLEISSGGTLQASSLSSAVNPGATGDILINGDTITLDSGVINARSFGTALPGSIVMNARFVTLDNGAVLSATGAGGGNAGNIVIGTYDSLNMLHGSRIVTEALNGSGGNIRLFINNNIVLRESVLSTSVLGAAANSGNITLDPLFVIVDNSQIIARAVGGSGGNIDVTTRYLLQSANSAIDASSALGINGRVEVFGVDVDINTDLTVLPTDFLNARRWLATPCASRQGNDVSQFTVNGRDGAYRVPFDFFASPPPLDFPRPSAQRDVARERRERSSLPLFAVSSCLFDPI